MFGCFNLVTSCTAGPLNGNCRQKALIQGDFLRKMDVRREEIQARCELAPCALKMAAMLHPLLAYNYRECIKCKITLASAQKDQPTMSILVYSSEGTLEAQGSSALSASSSVRSFCSERESIATLETTLRSGSAFVRVHSNANRRTLKLPIEDWE